MKGGTATQRTPGSSIGGVSEEEEEEIILGRGPRMDFDPARSLTKSSQRRNS